jgi:putative transposase
VQQAYVCGVSTRRVDQPVASLGLPISKSEVSRICALLDEHVQAFRTRPLEGRYPYLFLDAEVEKVRDGGRVVDKALVIAHGVYETGRCEILGRVDLPRPRRTRRSHTQRDQGGGARAPSALSRQPSSPTR